MRLIDADALIGDYDDIEIVAYHKDDVYEYISTKQIDSAPTIDAVEVVRCKDCKHWRCDENICLYHGIEGLQADDYCSYGERIE